MVVASTDDDEIQVLTEDRAFLGVIVARDHAGVAAVLDSGLLLDFSLENATVTMKRAATGQLLFS